MFKVKNKTIILLLLFLGLCPHADAERLFSFLQAQMFQSQLFHVRVYQYFTSESIHFFLTKYFVMSKLRNNTISAYSFSLYLMKYGIIFYETTVVDIK